MNLECWICGSKLQPTTIKIDDAEVNAFECVNKSCNGDKDITTIIHGDEVSKLCDM